MYSLPMPSFSDPIVCCALYFIWRWNGCLILNHVSPCQRPPVGSLFLCQCFVLVLQYEGLLLFSVNNCSSVVVKSVQRCWTCRLLAVVWCEHCFSVSLVYSHRVPLLVVLPIVVVSSLLYTWPCRSEAMCWCNHCCLSFRCVLDDQFVSLFKWC